jgi:anti-sigma-K factor RskA
VNTKAYIESGIIESYVLGLTSAEEAAELEQLCIQHTEIKNAVDEFSGRIEKEAFENAVIPPLDIRERLMSGLSGEFAEEERSVAPVIPIDIANTKNRSSFSLKYLAAASVILLIASTGLNFYLYNNYKSSTDKYQALLVERNSLQANNDAFRTKLDDLEKSMHIIEDPNMLVINLNGVKGKENNLATVYWDTKTKDVYLLPTKMDAPPTGKQYQLWAIVDGKPVNAGVINDCNGVCTMFNIQKAQAFAITLEKAGGSPTPTLSDMYVYKAI